MTDRRAAVFNGAVAFILFLTWVACNVAVGGVQFSYKTNDAYYDRMKPAQGDPLPWAQIKTLTSLPQGFRDQASACDDVAGPYVFFLAASWVLVVVEALLLTLRMFGKHGSMSSDRVLLIEIILSLALVFCFFLGVAIFGGGCVQKWRSFDEDNVSLPGFSYVVFALFFMMIVVVLNVIIKRDPTKHNLSGMGSTSPSSTTANTTARQQPAQRPANTISGPQISGPTRPPPPGRPPPPSSRI
jgi:hypothetical protein